MAVELLGAMGSLLEAEHLLEENKNLWSSNALLSSQGQQLIQQIHLKYLYSGADIITTNTYQASVDLLQEELNYSQEQATQLLITAVQLANTARNTFWEENSAHTHVERNKPLIAASCGPYAAKLHNLSEYSGDYEQVSVADLMKFHQKQWEIFNSLKEIDLILFETIPSFVEVQAVLQLMGQHKAELNKPFIISLACNESALNDSRAIAEVAEIIMKTVTENQLNDYFIAIGINCVLPKYCKGLIERINDQINSFNGSDSSLCSSGGGCNMKFPLILCYPNSRDDCWEKGSEQADYLHPNEQHLCEWSNQVMQWYAAGARIIGGCCTTTPQHIQAARQVLTNYQYSQGEE
jgi:homocysteine S-methyltransferase